MTGLEKIGLHFFPRIRIGIRDKIRTPVASTALLYVEVYVNGLVTQWDRLCDAGNERESLLAEGGDPRVWDPRQVRLAYLQDQITLDVHFYLICWDKVKKFLHLFEREQSNPLISAICKRFYPVLHKAGRARDFFEHLDKRARTNRDTPRALGVGGAGAMIFSYEDRRDDGTIIERRVDLGRSEVSEMIDGYNEILRDLGATV